jgi:hypothetical protein
MAHQLNPFEFDAATTLSLEDILDFYIEDYSYARFIHSQRNVFIAGERGSGKSMTLLYNSLPVQLLKAEQEGSNESLNFIGIYIPCNTPLMHKREYELVENKFHASVISEHLFVLSIIYEIANTLEHINGLADELEELDVRDELAYSLGVELPLGRPIFKGMKQFAQRELSKTQETINAYSFDEFYEGAYTFSSLVLPILRMVKQAKIISHTHFNLLFDDAHDLNYYQSTLLNSWVSYRDRSIFSLKIAIADFEKHDFHTSSNSSILEGHDFITLDMEKPFQRSSSPFGKFAKAIVEKRLEKWGCSSTAEEFFPINQSFVKALEALKEKTRQEGIEEYGESNIKKVNDYVYKNTRAIYFRSRDAKANLPPYSGWETITHVSTGVVRNLLEPCYWMYDQVLSEYSDIQGENCITINEIPADIQSAVILKHSENLWDWVRSSLPRAIDGCSVSQGKQVYNLFDNLAILFRERLLCEPPISEPRAVVFTISAMNVEFEKEISGLLEIARKARLLYFRSGPAKDSGKRETYYVPNRMLWPIRGLDVVGQHARVSLKAADILAAANGTAFPFDCKVNMNAPEQGSFDV